ncbi:hypothetical protein [Arthrobacter sp. Soil764]|uniref:hypothetical protein n=1 Tax=Arthrobacter sp. Soil764 TaxID=1736403 RepID=UPI0006FBF5EB|nr:hypothetical protein [Arthrobacter sp. Soil764]KRE91878.1 hypothetical protein ASG86_01600 [Arthrobacter sp. Soil764]
MSTSPGSGNPPDATPLNPDPTGQDPSAKDPAAGEKAQLQAAIFEVTGAAKGRSLHEIREMLQAEFSRRGVKAFNSIWLDSVASAAFHGEPYIIDFPAALAAEAAVPAPNDGVRKRLARRRELRQDKLPAGTFPPASAWELDSGDVTGGAPEPRPDPRTVLGNTRAVRQLLAVAASGAAALLAIAAVWAARNSRHRRTGRSTAGGA